MQNPLFNKKYLKDSRRELRNSGTAAEAVLWGYLKEKKLQGRKFRRQFSIGDFILDFYCVSEKLAVELDGQSHFTTLGAMNDEQKEEFLELQGIRVIRFENMEVFDNPEGVLKEIKKQFRESSEE